jgi:putative nucleotidyltransferase with HDIG domain
MKALVLWLQTFGAFERLKKDDRSLKPLWQHSWAVGRLAHRIGEAENFESYGLHQSLTAGLLHDVGKLVFLTGVPKQFARAVHLQREKNIAFWRAEQETFGCTHAEVGAYLLATWGLPLPVIETVALHHCPSASSTRSISVLTAVHVADALEREAESPDQTASIAELDGDYLGRLGLTGRLKTWRKLRPDVPLEPLARK